MAVHAASRDGVLAARMETPPGRRIRRRGNVAREQDALALHAGSGAGTAESSACVYGMIGSV
jgi:hypothetical protein